jgi:hypothetical protein
MQGPFYIGYDASGKKLELGIILADLTPAQLRRTRRAVKDGARLAELQDYLPVGNLGEIFLLAVELGRA